MYVEIFITITLNIISIFIIILQVFNHLSRVYYHISHGVESIALTPDLLCRATDGNEMVTRRNES